MLYLRASIFAASALLAAGAVANRAPAEGVRVDRLAGIYVASPVSATDQACVSDLQDGLKKLFGSSPRLLGKPPKTGSHSVLILGKEAALSTGRVTPNELLAADPDGYVIKCDNQWVVIAGAEAWTTRWGIYAFLEKLGLGYFEPSPSQARLAGPKPGREIKPFSISERPCFGYRSGWSVAYRETWPCLADPHNGLNPELFAKETGSDLWLDHTAGYPCPSDSTRRTIRSTTQWAKMANASQNSLTIAPPSASRTRT